MEQSKCDSMDENPNPKDVSPCLTSRQIDKTDRQTIIVIAVETEIKRYRYRDKIKCVYIY